jgi:hypothetical protein
MQLAVEYKRFLVVKELSNLFQNKQWHMLVERLLVDMSIMMVPGRLDPVFIKIDQNHTMYKMISFLSAVGFNDKDIQMAQTHLLNKINYYFDWLGSKAKPEEHKLEILVKENSAVVRYGEMIQRLHIDVYCMLKRLHVGNNFELDLAKCLLRYRSIVGTITQISMSIRYFSYLYDLGYRYEMASPFNFMFGLIEYRQGIKPSAGFYSLYPDVDKAFGSKGIIQEGFKPQQWTVYVPHFSYYTRDMFAKMIDTDVKNVIWVTKYEFICKDWHKIPVEGMLLTAIYHYGIIKESKASHMMYVYTSDDIKWPVFEHASGVNVIGREWNRLVSIDKIRLLLPDIIVDKFIMLMAMHSIGTNDGVFSDLPINHEVYKQLKVDMIKRKLPDYTQSVYDIVKEYLSLPPIDRRVTYTITDSFVLFDDRAKTVSVPLDTIRGYALIDRAISNGSADPIYDLIVCMLRYESIKQKTLWSIPYVWYKELYNNYMLRTECFVNPLNSQLLMLDYLYDSNQSKFISLFPDIDMIFGSSGTFNQLDHDGTVVMNPPYVSQLLEQAADKVEKLLATKQVLIFINLPSHYDASYYKKILNNRYLIDKKIMPEPNMYQEDGNDIRAGLFTSFVLTNIALYKSKDYTEVFKFIKLLNG